MLCKVCGAQIPDDAQECEFAVQKLMKMQVRQKKQK